MLEHHTLKRVFLNKPCSIYATNLTMTLQVFQNKNTANTIPYWLSIHEFLHDFKLKNIYI